MQRLKELKHPDYKFMAIKSPGVARYIWWILVFAVVAIGLALFVVRYDGSRDESGPFIAEVLGIGFCINIIAALVVISFFEQRDQRRRATNERSAARRVALEIKRYLKVHPLPDVTVLRDKLEYLHDTLSFALNDGVKRDIERFLHDSEDDAIGSRPDQSELHDIETIAAALEKRYGKEIFETVKTKKAAK